MQTPSGASFSGKLMHLPWHQADTYWLCTIPQASDAAFYVRKALGKAGITEREGVFMQQVSRQWGSEWKKLQTVLADAKGLENVAVAVIAGTEAPSLTQINAALMSAAQVDAIADSLWLGDALTEGRVMCYLQPVMTGLSKIFGYESFARARAADGGTIDGGAIVKASKALCIEYAIDRQLHVEAIRTFASSAFNGCLFVNFFPGFIQRPEVYLEGLSETARANGIISKNIVLDFTRCESQHDVQHLKRVTEYCRSRGYAIALDDLETAHQTRNLLEAVKPDYVKLEMKLARGLGNSNQRETVRQIVDLCHARGAVVLAEGVETEETFEIFKAIGVDLFQGYYFSPPVPVETIIQRRNQASA
ncbi:MAG: EAL domain-containing protein [Alphaproteobacteria bacterium]|nr:EAL domain-containing protein [Alphaproteobacteria bacterium]